MRPLRLSCGRSQAAALAYIQFVLRVICVVINKAIKVQDYFVFKGYFMFKGYFVLLRLIFNSFLRAPYPYDSNWIHKGSYDPFKGI